MLDFLGRETSGFDEFVAGDEELHEAPGGEVADAADAEHDEVAGGLALEAEKLHVGFRSVIEQDAGAEVDQEAAESAGHSSDTDDGGDGALGEHVAGNGIYVGRPGLMRGSADAYDDDGIPV